MKITIKLFASFRIGRFDIREREYPESTTVAAIVADLKLLDDELGIMMVNSRHVRSDHELKEGDTLSLFPLLGGG